MLLVGVVVELVVSAGQSLLDPPVIVLVDVGHCHAEHFSVAVSQVPGPVDAPALVSVEVTDALYGDGIDRADRIEAEKLVNALVVIESIAPYGADGIDLVADSVVSGDNAVNRNSPCPARHMKLRRSDFKLGGW